MNTDIYHHNEIMNISILANILALLSGVSYLTLLPAGFKASVGAGSSTSKLAGFHVDLLDMAPADYWSESQQSTKEIWW